MFRFVGDGPKGVFAGLALSRADFDELRRNGSVEMRLRGEEADDPTFLVVITAETAREAAARLVLLGLLSPYGGAGPPRSRLIIRPVSAAEGGGS